MLTDKSPSQLAADLLDRFRVERLLVVELTENTPQARAAVDAEVETLRGRFLYAHHQLHALVLTNVAGDVDSVVLYVPAQLTALTRLLASVADASPSVVEQTLVEAGFPVVDATTWQSRR